MQALVSILANKFPRGNILIEPFNNKQVCNISVDNYADLATEYITYDMEKMMVEYADKVYLEMFEGLKCKNSAEDITWTEADYEKEKGVH